MEEYFKLYTTMPELTFLLFDIYDLSSSLVLNFCCPAVFQHSSAFRFAFLVLNHGSSGFSVI